MIADRSRGANPSVVVIIRGNIPTVIHSANPRGVVGTEKLWGQSPLASRVASEGLAG